MTIDEATMILRPEVEKYNAELYSGLSGLTSHIFFGKQEGNLLIFDIVVSTLRELTPEEVKEDDVASYWQVNARTGAVDIRIF